MNETIMHGHWVHSHEEDSKTEMVYRPTAYDFPRARGRYSFQLNPDHVYVEFGIGPTDRPEEFEGKWDLDSKGVLRIYDTDGTGLIRSMSVVSVEANRLVIEK